MTIRRVMGVVVGAALALGLIVPALRVWLDPAHRFHYHSYTNQRGDLQWSHANPFWPRYRASLLGRSWDSDASCRETGAGGDWAANVPAQFLREDYDEVGSGDDLVEIKSRAGRKAGPPPIR